MSLHLDYCASFGLTKGEIESYPETQGSHIHPVYSSPITELTFKPACTAYSRYILDVGQSDDWLALQMALAPCLLGYGAIARRLYTEKSTVRAGNRYWKWIENYVADDYTQAVAVGSSMLSLPDE